MRYPARSVQVARETGIRTRSRMMSEALPTMRYGGALHPTVLLARVVPRLREKLPSDAPKIGTSSRRELDVVIGLLASKRPGHFRWELVSGTLRQPANPDNEQGKEPSQAYRQSLQHHADATYVNLGTLYSSPKRSRPACGQCCTRGGAFVVVRGW